MFRIPWRTGQSALKNRLIAFLPRKLSTQLIALFMGTFVSVVTISFLVIYSDMADMLHQSYESSSIQRFRQADYDIASFCSEVDRVSRQLVIDADLQGLNSYASLSQADKVSRASMAVRLFNGILSNYRDINSILYYSSEGLILKTSANANVVLFGPSTASDWFYQSEAYQASYRNKQKMVWFGGYTNKDFGVTKRSSAGSEVTPVYYVSASRNVLSGKETGTLVINIDAATFTSVYSNQADNEGGRMYVVDGNGRVISGNDAVMIGTISETRQTMDAQRTIESFTFASKGRKIRAVYYRLGTPIGTLVKEIPESVLMKNTNNLRLIVLLMFSVSLLLAFGLSRFWLLRLMRPFRELVLAIRGVGQGNLGLTIENPPRNELGTLIDQFNRMSANIKELFDQKGAAEAGKRDLEMVTLRSQINPHFVYNTLNNIRWMAVIDRKKNIADCLTTFTEFLQVVLREHEPMCTLREEINHLRNYIKIMNFRFGGGLQLDTDIAVDDLECRIVRFLLQPVVENSVIHGIDQQLSGGIRLGLSHHGDDIEISVADNGKGIEPARLDEVNRMLQESPPGREPGIGLANVNKRLRLHFGQRYGVRISSKEDGGTVATLTMPFVR